MLSLIQAIQRVSKEFGQARKEEFTDHPMAKFIRRDWPKAATNAIASFAPKEIAVDASPGQSQWNEAPWLAFLDKRVTTSAQRGYYPVFLFEPGLTSCCLVLGQGADSLKKQFGRNEALRIVERRAEALRKAASGWEKKGFSIGPFRTLSRIPSKGSDERSDPWSKSVAFGKRYDMGNPPTDAQLEADLNAMLELYAKAIRSIGTTFVDEEEASEELAGSGELPAGGLDGAVKVVAHKSEERRMRNSKLVKDAKKHHGYRCQGCGIDLAMTYTGLPKPYVEAHHLRPLSAAPKEGEELTVLDLCVLCPTCHRVIHRMGCPDLPTFVKHVPQSLRDFHTKSNES